MHFRRVSQVDREELQGENLMKFFITGVNGQLGHDVMNELYKRGHEGVGSDLADAYAGVADGSPVTTMPYVSLDITDKEAVMKTITEIKPDAVIHCAAWTAVDMAEDDDKVDAVRRVNAGGTQNIADACTMPPIGAASAWRVAGNGGVLRLKHCKYDFYYLCRVNDIAT